MAPGDLVRMFVDDIEIARFILTEPDWPTATA